MSISKWPIKVISINIVKVRLIRSCHTLRMVKREH